LFTFRVEGRDAKTVAESTTPRIIPVIEELSGHDFAYFNRARRWVGRGNARTLGGIVVPPGTLQKSVTNPIDTRSAAFDAGT
jgi:hypothetical protein